MARPTKTKKTANSANYKKEAAQEQYTPQQFIDALTTYKGMKTLAARSLGCSPHTLQRYVDLYPEVAEALETAHENMLDTIELKAYDRCMKDDTTMIIFMLKTQGKARGYVEKTQTEVSGVNGGAIEIKAIDYRAALESLKPADE